MKRSTQFLDRGLSRREFLKRSLVGAAAGYTIPSFLGNTFFQIDAHAQGFPPTEGDGPILVIMQMAGGNDSLNTVIPFENDGSTAESVGG